MNCGSKHRHGGALLAECLIELGASKCFGVPGESYLTVLDALHDTAGRLDYIACRNEGGASFMSAAYGKLTGTPGICFVTRGPGASNASIGVHTAMQDSVPMILFVGQVSTTVKGREAFQEIDYCAFFGSIAKWVTEISSVDRIPEIIYRAWSTSIAARPGPVVVSLPEDVITEYTSVLTPGRPANIQEPAPSEEAIEQTVSMLSSASRPLVVIGGGGWKENGKMALQNFAERHEIPVLAAFRFQDLFDNNSSCYAGDLGVGLTDSTRKLVSEADLVVALNIRFGEMTTDGYSLFRVPKSRQRLIHAHASDRELGKVYSPDLAVHSGPNQFSCAMVRQTIDKKWPDWCARARNVYESTFEIPDQPGTVDMGKITAYLRNRLPDDAVLTNGAGNFTVWPNKFFKFVPSQRLLAPQSGAMGYGIPAAIAAKIVAPHRVVVCFCGDGDFQMNCQEMGTAAQYQAQPIILVLNNGIYGTIRMHQEQNFPSRVSGTTLKNPEFCTLAESYGFYAERVSHTGQFADAFERALASQTGALLELKIDQEALTPRKTLSQIRDSAYMSPV